jgi:hypothetical protein
VLSWREKRSKLQIDSTTDGFNKLWLMVFAADKPADAILL